MTTSGFGRALPRVLAHEGGYVNDPKDPGGATNKGVTYRVYDAYRTRKGLPTQDVRDISPGEISEIYRLQYWDACKCDELPPGVDYVLFDGAVNSGPTQSIKWLQRALGNVIVDGQMGQSTLQAVREYDDPSRLIDVICDRRLAFLQALKTWNRFGKGWASRVAGVRKTGKAYAIGVGGLPIRDVEHTPRALMSDAKIMPGNAGADVATTSGVATGGVAATLQQAQDTLSPFSYISENIAMIVTCLVVAGAALTIGGMAWRWYASRKAKRIADALDFPHGVTA